MYKIEILSILWYNIISTISAINNDLKGVLEMSKIKDLNLTNLKKEDKKLDTQKESTVFIGDTEYKFKVDTVFRKSKQHKVIDDLISFFNAGAKNARILEVSTPYITLLLIKHFTSIEISDDVDEALDMLNVLIDLELLDKVSDELPIEETGKILKLLSDVMDNMKRNLEESDKEADKILKKIENQEVKDLLLNE